MGKKAKLERIIWFTYCLTELVHFVIFNLDFRKDGVRDVMVDIFIVFLLFTGRQLRAVVIFQQLLIHPAHVYFFACFLICPEQDLHGLSEGILALIWNLPFQGLLSRKIRVTLARLLVHL